MSDDYIPISCASHSAYELAIMRGQVLKITWHDMDGMQYSEKLVPHDLVTESGIEYLLGRNSHGKEKKIRLDKIIEAYPV